MESILLQQPGGPIPHNMAQGFDAPPTIKHSGSDPTGANFATVQKEGGRLVTRQVYHR